MRKLFKSLSVDFIEPINMFEQLEERIVLDATIAQIDTNPAQSGGDVTVQQDQTVTADAQANDEGQPGFHYDLQVNGQNVSQYNTDNPVGAADIALDPNFTENGRFSWTPNNLDVGVTTFTVISYDDATSTSDSMSFTVTTDNLPPTITSPAICVFSEDQPNQTFNITVDPSTDLGKGLTFSLVNQNPMLGSWFHLNPDSGVITVDSPADADNGTYTLDIRADDGHASTVQLGFQLVIQNRMDITSANSHNSLEDQQLLFNVQTDTETAGSGPVSYSLVVLNPGESVPGWIGIDSATGVITGNPDNTMVGTYHFTVRAQSAEGDQDQPFTLTIENADPLFLNHETAFTFTETSGNQTFDVQNNDEGMVESGNHPYDIISITFNGVSIAQPSWLTIDHDSGLITGNPLSDDVGTYIIRVQFDDGNLASNSVTHEDFTLTVENIDNFFTTPPATIWTEDASNPDFEVDTHEEGRGAGYSVYYDIIGAPSWVVFRDTGTQSDSLDGILMQNGVVDNSMVGDHFFTIRSYEGPDQLHPINIVDQPFTLTVANVAPVIVTPATISIQEDTPAGTYILSLNSPEPNNAGHPAVTWTIDHAPTIDGVPVTITKIDDQTAQLTYASPKNADVDGVYVFNVTVTDGNGGIATKFFQLAITNKVPQFTELPDPSNDPQVIRVDEDSSYSVDINIASPLNDEGDGPTWYGLVGGPGFVTIDSATGLLSINSPDNTQVGTHNFQVSLNDGHGGIVYAWFQVIVDNVAPILPGTGSAIWYEDGDTNQDGTPDGEGWQTTAAAGVPGAITDIGQGATFSLGGSYPTWLTIDATTGRMSYVPANAEVGVHTFTVHLEDGHGGTADQTFTLDVRNSPPSFDGLYGSGATTLYVNVDGGVQLFDFQTTDESSNRNIYGGTPNEYSLSGEPAGIALVPVTGSTTGQFSVDPTMLGLGNYTFTITFFDGSTTVDKVVTVVVTDIPPNGTDPGNFDAGFYSPNNTSFIEDTGSQTFNLQYSEEGTNTDLRYELIGAPAWLVFQDNGIQTGSSTGVITGDPTNVETTDVNPGVPYTFQVHVYDGSTVNVTVDFDLSVTNNPPLFDEAPFNVVFIEDVTYTPATTPYDVHTSDEPHNNPLYPNAYSLEAIDAFNPVPAWLKIDADTGRIYVDKGASDPNRYMFVNDDDFGPAGGYDVKVVFNDAHGAVIERAINVSIANRLDFTDSGHHYAVIWQEDRESPFNTVVFEATTDDDPSATKHVTYSLANIPSWLIDDTDPFNPISMIQIDSATGVVTMAPGYESFVPDNTIPGTYHFTIVADDTHGTATHDVSLTVPNRDPHFIQTSFTMQEDLGQDTVNLQVDDEDQGTSHWYYTWSGAPQWMKMDPFTGVITADPTNQHVGTYSFTVTAYDLNAGRDAGYSATELALYGDDPNLDGIRGFTTETIAIEVANRAPVFDTAAAATATEDAAFSFNVHQDDEGDGGSHYSLVGAPSWLTIDAQTGIITGTPENADVGPDSPGLFTFLIRADDTHLNGITDQLFTLTVNNRLSFFTNGNNGTPNSYFFHLTEDAAAVSFDLTSEDEGRHVSGGGTTQTGAVYYYLDPSVVTPGVRFIADGTSWQIADPDQPGLYLSSITGKMQLAPTNSDVYGNHLPGIDFQVQVYDGHTDGSGNPTFTTADFNFAIDNTIPEFQTPNQIIWVEDHSIPVADIDNTDEPFPRYRTDVTNPQIYYDLVNAPAWLRINNLFPDDPLNTYHRELGQLYVADAYTTNSDGTPDNNLVGTYTFEVRFFDGTVWIQQAQPFQLQINNDPTEITNLPGDQHLVEDTTMIVTDAEIQARDEYGPTFAPPGYPQDYYELFIDWENQDGLNNNPGSWLTLAQYNALNDAWDPTAANTANDITFDIKTGAITWIPNNGDVPNDADTSGLYRHEFIVVHHDGGANGYAERTTDTGSFFVYVDNVAPTISVPPAVENAVLTEDTLYRVLPTDVSSSDEGQNLRYVLTMEVDGVWRNVTTGFRPYGGGDSAFTFDPNTGEIRWTPRNRDVSYDPLGVQQPYHLQLWADDGNADNSNPNQNLSLIEDLYWTVQETPTGITSAPPVHGTATEGTAFTWNIQARDESSDRGGTNPVDTRYTLLVFYDGSYQPYTSYNADHPTMGPLTFNTKNGLISWTPNDLDAIAYHTDALPFRVIHDDDNGDTDSRDFDLTVTNTAPIFTTPLPPATWELYEDDNTTVPGYTNWIDIQTDDETQGGVTYSLTVAKGTDTYTLGTDASDRYDASNPEMLRHKINGDEGGYIVLNTQTGVISWATTNADVTNAIDDTLLSPFGLYRFTVTATDHYNTSVGTGFDVKVFNTETLITPAIGHQTLTEDDPQWKLSNVQVNAIDEETQDTGTNYRDAFYQVWVDNHQVVPDDPETAAPGQVWFHYTPNDEYDIDATHHVQSGATIYVNKDTGEIRWIDAGDNPLDDPDAYPTALGPNNRDVLDGHVYQFQVRHNDGNLHYFDDYFTVTVGNDIASLNDLSGWNLLEDHTNPAAPYDPYVYDPGLVTSDDESYGLTYELFADGNAVNSGDRINGLNGGQIFFDRYSGEITWLTTNADVTRHEDQTTPGTFVDERAPYVFTIIADDGNTSTGPDQRVAKSFSVTVTNDPTSIGLENPGDHYNPDPLPATVTINEDVLWDTFNVGSRDEDVETDAAAPPDPPWQDSFYELMVTHNSTDYWVVHETDPTKYNPTTSAYTSAFSLGGADLTFNKEDGQFSWMPNNADVGSYTFTVIHHDGHDSTATGVFTVTVENRAPDFEPPTPTVEELFVEDSTDAPDFSFTVQTDDQNQGGVTYTVAFGVGTDAATTTYDTVYDSSHTTGHIPNMDVGGVDRVGLISFDPLTNSVTWHTSNADVNWSGTDYLDADQKYFFRVTAADHHGAESLTSTHTFEAKVTETATIIDQVTFTGMTDGTSTAATDTSNPPDVAAIKTATEGVLATIDFGANDEQQETGDASFFRDSYYVLTVTGPDGAGGNVTHDFLYVGDHTVQTWQQSGLGLFDGGTMTFDPDTGLVTLTPNDRDVGTWTFTATHYDGQGSSDPVTVQVIVGNTDPDLTVPATWVFQEYPINAQDAASHAVVPSDWLISQNQVWSDDEGLRVGFTYSMEVTDGGGTVHVVNQAIPAGIDHTGDPDWVGAQINGTDGGWLLLNVRTGQIEWKTTNADVTRGFNNEDLGRNPYGFDLKATDPSGGESAVKSITVDVLNRDTGIIVSTIDDSQVTEHTLRSFNIDALDEQIERYGLDTTYLLQVHIDTDSNGTLEWIDVDDYNSIYRGGRAPVTFYEEPAGLIPAGYFAWTPNDFDSIAGQLEFRVYHDDGNLSEPHHDFILTLGNRTPVFTSFPGPGPVMLTEDAFVNGLPADQYTIFDWQIQTNEELVGVTYSLDVTDASGTTVHVNDSIPVGIDHFGDPDWVGAQINSGGGWVLFNTLTAQTEWKTTNADVTVDTGTAIDPANAYTFSVTADDHTTNGPEPPTVTRSFAVQVLNDPTDITTDVPDQTFEQGVPWRLGDDDVVDRDECVGSNTWYTLMVGREGDAPVDVAAYNTRVTQPDANGTPIVFEPLTGEISWESTTNRDVGLYHFEIIHHDGHNTTDTDFFDVTVTNKVPVWTTSPPSGQVVMATKEFVYDADTDEEGHHDWRGDDVVRYSIVQGPSSMTIDSETGFINWTADPKLAGPVTVTIEMDDGNGGVIHQTFTIIVDDTRGDLPIEMRPDFQGWNNTGPNGPAPNPGPFGRPEFRFPLDNSPLPIPEGSILEEILKKGLGTLDDLLAGLDDYDLKQPNLDKLGSISPITPLSGYPDPVAHGNRLNFSAEEIFLCDDIKQPNLDIGGSESPDTPLEGFGPEVEAGKRLNFNYFPIRETVSLRLSDLTVGNLLGLY